MNILLDAPVAIGILGLHFEKIVVFKTVGQIAGPIPAAPYRRPKTRCPKGGH